MSQIRHPGPAAFRSPRRVTVTLPLHTYEQLQRRCDQEGRSLSNLAAFLIEVGLQGGQLRPGVATAARTIAAARA